MLTGSRGSCSRGDSCRSHLTAHSFMPFSICIFESKLCSSEDEKYLQQNCALLQRSHTQETVWPQQTVPHLQYFPSHNPRWKASTSFLLVGEVPISTQQRYLISKRCATLKAHRHFQPFFISFQQQVIGEGDVQHLGRPQMNDLEEVRRHILATPQDPEPDTHFK